MFPVVENNPFTLKGHQCRFSDSNISKISKLRQIRPLKRPITCDIIQQRKTINIHSTLKLTDYIRLKSSELSFSLSKVNSAFRLPYSCEF